MAALDFDRIRSAPVHAVPFPHLLVEDAIRPEAVAALAGQLPTVAVHGSQRLDTLARPAALDALVADLESDRFRRLMEEKFGLDLSAKEVLTTYRGWMRREDGVIHTDTPAKTLTTLLYLNPPGAADAASLRLLRSPRLDDHAVEIPPHMGRMVVFKVTDNCWHGHASMEGPRHSLQMNYLSGLDVKGHERFRRALSKIKRRLFA